MGPVEVLVVMFPGSRFNGALAPALREVVAAGHVSIIDLVFLSKEADGSVIGVEVDELEPELLGDLPATTDDLLGLLNEADLEQLGAALAPGSSAAAVVFEHTWARNLAAAVADSDGQVIFADRIPRDVVAAAVAAASKT